MNLDGEEKDIDFEVKSAENATKGFVGLSRMSISKYNSHGSRDNSEDKRIDQLSVKSSHSYQVSPMNNLQEPQTAISKDFN